MKPVRISVVGTPKAQPRARARVVCGHGGVYDPGTADDWKALVMIASARAGVFQPSGDALAIDIEFRFDRPRSHYGTGKRSEELKPSAPHWHTVKPDRDNLDKCILDALVGCGVLSDDKCVCDGRISKRYCRLDERPGCEIVIREPVEDTR